MKTTGKFLRTTRILLLIFVAVLLTQTIRPAYAGYPASSMAAKEQPITVTLADWGYEDVTLHGPYGSAVYSLGLPADWEVKPGSQLNLDVNFSVSKLVAQDPTSQTPLKDYTPAVILQVFLNDVEITSINQVETGKSKLIVPLPESWPQPKGEVNQLKIVMSIYGHCEYYPVSSLIIGKESSLQFAYGEKDLVLDLAGYPRPFYQKSFLPDRISIVLPQKPTQTELDTAFAITAGLGSLTGGRMTVTMLTDADFRAQAEKADANGPQTGHVILVGTQDSNSLIKDLMKTGGNPVKAVERRYKLTTSGPGVVAAGQPAAYRIELKNIESAILSKLVLTAQIPESAEGVQCDPKCSTEKGVVTWQVDRIRSGATASYTVTYTMGKEADAQGTRLIAELWKEKQLLNSSTLSSSVGGSGTADTIQSTSNNGQFFLADNQTVAESDGILLMAASPWKAGKAVLMVTGHSDAAVQKAGRALNQPALFPGMKGPVAIIADVLPASTTLPARRASFTLADLGYTDETFIGIGQKNIFYQFLIPFNWTLSADAGAVLSFSHSALLDPAQSSISIFLNDKPVATAALDENNTTGGQLIAKLPLQNVRPGLINTLQVQIESELRDPCVIPESAQAWVTVQADSSVNLAHSEVDVKGLMDLDYWPQEFLTQPDLSNLMLALPEQPTQDEWNLAAKIALYLGSAGNSSDAKMKTALGDPGEAELGKYQVILIGRPTRNALVQKVSEQLPQPFLPGTDEIRQKVDNVIFRLPKGLELGYLQLIPSPWDAGQIVLALTGTTDAAVQQASEYLVNSQLNWELKGNLAMTRDGKLYTLDTRAQTEEGAAQFTATLVPEATQAEPIAMVAPTQAANTGVTVKQDVAVPPSYPQQYPYLLPGIVGVGVLIIVIILSAAVIRRGHTK